jgi:hypothetical protein
VLHCIAMPALVYLRSSFGYVFLRPKSIFFAFSWALALFAIVAWNEPALWLQVRALCIFAIGAIFLYWLHLFRSMLSEFRQKAEHDNYAGTSHVLRLIKWARVTPPENLEAKLFLWVEPAMVLVVAVVLRVVSERYLSNWLFLTTAALCMKEVLNQWIELRRAKRRKDMIKEAEKDFEAEPDRATAVSGATKTARKPAKDRPRRDAN